MDGTLESTFPINNGNIAPDTSGNCLAEEDSCRLTASPSQWFTKGLIFRTLPFLLGSIVFIILSEVIRAKQKLLGQDLSDDLNPSCTDFGNSAAEQRFALDLAFGNFTFTQAKLIDATWDTVIGQGGRLVHGWILYCCIIYPLLVLAMEISTVTYPYYTTLSFSKASFETLIQLLRALHITKSYSVLLCSILLIYSLTYTLFFSVIWGTATGYLSLSHKLYALPGGEIIPLNSGNLSLCWVLDPTRFGLPTPHVEIGPNFSDILSTQRSSSLNESDVCLNISKPDLSDWSKYKLRYDTSGWNFKNTTGSSIWDLFAVKTESNSANFINIQRYALEKQFLQIGLNAEGWVHSASETTLNKTLFEDSVPATLNWFNSSDSTSSKCNNITRYGLHPTIRAVTLENEKQRPSTQDMVNTVKIPPYNDSTPTAYWSLFVLNQTVGFGPGVVPYNSTIWLNGSSFALDAPFLDFGLGNCVCYNGQPISPDLLSNDRAICNTAPGYVWGFSSYITRAGLILEAVWMVCCFVAYPWLLCRSELLHLEPIKSAKAMRLLLDCSEAISDEIGVNAKSLREEAIVRRLKNIKIGYHTDAPEGSVCHNQIKSVGGIARGIVTEAHGGFGDQSVGVEVSGLTTKGFSERYSPVKAKLYDIIFLVEKKVDKKARRLDTVLEKTVPILGRIANHPIHNKMNELFEGVVAAWRSSSISGKRKPAVNEVYEDTNWRFSR
ncbi:hypothetical protein F5Y10DRAFT_291740 [Nemania abortiva]|nr:hypothetical protein F5Y10DRAFT_291740 [Nemania abortiva]